MYHSTYCTIIFFNALIRQCKFVLFKEDNRMIILSNPSDFNPKSITHQHAQMLVEDLATYNKRINSFSCSIDKLRERQNFLRFKKDEVRKTMQEAYESSLRIASVNNSKIDAIKIEREGLTELLKSEVKLESEFNESENEFTENPHSKIAQELRSKIFNLDQDIIKLRSEISEWKSLCDDYRQDYHNAKNPYNESWAELGRLSNLFDSLAPIRNFIIDSLEIIAFNNAVLVGVPQYLVNKNDLKIVIDYSGDCNYFFDGNGKPDGENHKHICADIFGNIKYNRPHGAN